MFLFYIDDSGQIDYHPKASEYFVYNALGFDSSKWNEINQQVVELKQKFLKLQRQNFWKSNLTG